MWASLYRELSVDKDTDHIYQKNAELSRKQQTLYYTFAKIVTAFIVLAFGDLSLLTIHNLGPIENNHIILFDCNTIHVGQNRDNCHSSGIQ